MRERDNIDSVRKGAGAHLLGQGLIYPLSQGDLDGLCGLYAIINAIRLICAPITPISQHEANDLFYIGIDYLGRKQNVAAVMKNGMRRKRQTALAKKLMRHATQGLGRPLQIHPIRCAPDKCHELIWREINQGNPVCALFDGALDHYTVISGVSDKRIKLFDSANLSWVLRSSCAYDDRVNVRHTIVRRSLFSITPC